ncbi:hypothetical protein ACWD5V_37960 [Streptomyces sp. NPDC002523]
MNRPALSVIAVASLLALAGCRSRTATGRHTGPAEVAPPCASRGVTAGASPGPTAEPIQTKIAWRAEELPGGSLRMTVGDVDAAPKDPRAVRRTDFRAPGNQTECDNTKIIKVRGWWCTTTVSSVAQDGEIVLGGAEPRARIHSAGFRTHCSGDRPQMRQHYEIQRDSWSGWRPYSERGLTSWTSEQRQSHGRVSVPCPDGRVGTYDYRLAVAVEVQGIEADDSTAASAPIRTDCGTGIS